MPREVKTKGQEMKLRLANKVIRNALESGIDPRADTLRRAVAAFPQGAKHHPRKYLASGLTAAFIRMGHSIHGVRFGLDSARITKDIEATK